ncbi:alpha/beta fold hydrolase [Oricola cellulosilytica]|nr:alpha/beta fold hydrolase [Oricola cellulosilytica]
MFHRMGNQFVHSVSFGAGEPPLVAIPGSIANWEIWQPPLEILSERWRVIALDHAGVGQTRVPPDEISFETQVETVLSVLDSRGIDACVLASDSHNVAVAIEVALRCPGRVRGLVLMAGLAWGFDTPETRRFIEALEADFGAAIGFFARACLPEENSGHLRQWLTDILKSTGPERIVALLRSYFPVDLRDRLSDIAVPTLVVAGALDALSANRKDFEYLASQIPGARLELIDGAGHIPMFSEPEKVAALISAHMRDITAG